MLARLPTGQTAIAMGTRTHLAGAYRREIGEAPCADIETYTYAAGDILLGQDGWTLSSMHQASDQTTTLHASGRWEHPLHRGNWHRIVSEEAEISRAVPGGATTRASFRIDRDDLVVSNDGRTNRHRLPDATLLVPDLHACLGPMIEIASHMTAHSQQLSIVVVASRSVDQGQTISEPSLARLRHYRVSADRVGQAEIATPDGPIRADEYAVEIEPIEANLWAGIVDLGVDMGDAGGPWWDALHRPSTARWYLGGDGLLAAYADGDAIVWRAASAPSRA